jgi:putative ABC transport system ATP-binding protein
MSLSTQTTPDTATAAAKAELIIQAVGVVKTYNTGKVRVPALRGLDLAVERGDMVAIMGPSGCGKTTLLNCLSGLDTIDEGQILIENTDLSKLSDNARTEYRAANMGFVFQFYNLLPVLSAVENVELPLLVSGAKPKQARAKALAILERVGLKNWANQRPAELSGGQRQRVTIARALVNDPAIVWADEPTGDLDSETADEIMALMIELNRTQQQTFVIVTHDARIGGMTNHIIRMRDGVVVGDEANQNGAAVAAPAR